MISYNNRAELVKARELVGVALGVTNGQYTMKEAMDKYGSLTRGVMNTADDVEAAKDCLNMAVLKIQEVMKTIDTI